MGDLDPIYIHASLGPSTSTIQMASKSTQPFLHGSWQNVIWDVGACPFPSKLPLPMGIWTPRLTRGSLGLTPLSIPSQSQLGQPFLQGSRKSFWNWKVSTNFLFNCCLRKHQSEREKLLLSLTGHIWGVLAVIYRQVCLLNIISVQKMSSNHCKC